MCPCTEEWEFCLQNTIPWGHISTENPGKRMITEDLNPSESLWRPALIARTHVFITWGSFLPGLKWLTESDSTLSHKEWGFGYIYDRSTYTVSLRILTEFKLRTKMVQQGLEHFYKYLKTSRFVKQRHEYLACHGLPWRLRW